jgi:hypothetical protein
MHHDRYTFATFRKKYVNSRRTWVTIRNPLARIFQEEGEITAHIMRAA